MFESVSSKSEPQFAQVFHSYDIFPHSLQIFILDFNKLRLINAINNINIGTKNISIKIFPRKCSKKLIPKIGRTNKNIEE